MATKIKTPLTMTTSDLVERIVSLTERLTVVADQLDRILPPLPPDLKLVEEEGDDG